MSQDPALELATLAVALADLATSESDAKARLLACFGGQGACDPQLLVRACELVVATRSSPAPGGGGGNVQLLMRPTFTQRTAATTARTWLRALVLQLEIAPPGITRR